MTRWNWALKWYGIFSAQKAFPVDPEAYAENDEQLMCADDRTTLPETSEPDRDSLAVTLLSPQSGTAYSKGDCGEAL
jgi:hypothetical protein